MTAKAIADKKRVEKGKSEMEHEKKNKGIVCDVRKCVYHDKDNYCTASQIAVGPSYAESSSETVCATFKPNDCENCK